MNRSRSIIVGAFIVLIAVYAGFKIYAAGIAKEKIDTALVGVEAFVKVEYNDVSVDLLNRNVHITDVVILPADSQEPLNIAEVVIYDIDQTSQIPTFLEIAANGIEIVPDKKDAQTWQELGISDKIKLDFSGSYQYENDSNQLNLDKINFRGQDIGELNMDLFLGDLPGMTNGLAGLLFTYPMITLHRARINIKPDASLIERYMEVEAANENKSVDELKKEAFEGIDKQIALVNKDFMRDALEALKDFIDNPDQLSISLAPDRPLSIQELVKMNGPVRVAEELKLSVTN